jgi:hypothetical protein
MWVDYDILQNSVALVFQTSVEIVHHSSILAVDTRRIHGVLSKLARSALGVSMQAIP